ncbi:hypothetical protein PoB_000009500 [Plakobranchus ocellatus]|uniref:Peptidase A2 domain-containing protein n=1 Tax=Plakobranchus ocellatus TaxID=259542 RepID=A0AAV3XR16_9GAST|nr:hypothetical protein PoB_000009500 [Plakobranchus ocellatus]
MDTGAVVTVIPMSLVSDETKIEKANTKLFGPGHDELKVLGKVNATMRETSQLVDDIPGVICDIDDILIMGQTKEQHDSRVR